MQRDMRWLFIVISFLPTFMQAYEIDSKRLELIDSIVAKAIECKHTSGAVVVVGHKDSVIYRKAFGKLSFSSSDPMLITTLFDLASLTKVFTATALLILVEKGLIRLSAPVSLYIPEFAQNGKESVTVEQLLLHSSGLPAANSLSDYSQGVHAALHTLYKIALKGTPGKTYIYSCLGYILLGDIIQRVSGKTLQAFLQETVLQPLNMHATSFLPSENSTYSIAPTEEREGMLLQGKVHDPRAYALGGVAGNAGLFSTADDLAIFCTMIVNHGVFRGSRILSMLGITKMLKPHELPEGRFRGLGWDMKTEHSTCQGDFFPFGTVSHTGFTGTSIVIDPVSKIFIIVLTNKVQPQEYDIKDLRASIANIVASALYS
jgi:CubicO group peptidase (beta-lactamase class C family)